MPMKVKKVLESEAEIKARLKKESNKIKRTRLQMLLFFKEEPRASYKKAGKILGYSKYQIARWWRVYEEGGIDRLLEVKKRGKKKGEGQKVPDEAFERLEEKMRRGEIRTIKDGVNFIKEEYGVRYSISRMHVIFREKLRAKKKSGRPYSVRKDPKKADEFKKKVVILKGKRVMWEDEMRVGLIVKHRKVWMPKGERADWPVQHKVRVLLSLWCSGCDKWGCCVFHIA